MKLARIDDDLCTVEDEPIYIHGSICDFYSILVKRTNDYIKEQNQDNKLKIERELSEIRKTLKTLSETIEYIKLEK